MTTTCSVPTEVELCDEPVHVLEVPPRPFHRRFHRGNLTGGCAAVAMVLGMTFARTASAIMLTVVSLAACSSGQEARTGGSIADEQVTESSPPTTAAGDETTTTASPSTTAATTTTTERAKTGTVQTCTDGVELLDVDKDGWGVCPTPTTTIDPAIDADLAVLFAGQAVLDPEINLAGAIESDIFSVESVDLINYVAEPSTFQLAVTSGYNGIEFRDEVAWEIVGNLGFLWSTENDLFRNDVGTIKTGLELTVDTTRYVAPYDLMVLVADRQITSTDWLNLARQP